ncbi:MAG: Uncharacterised protein [Flavobacteriaceae bacterium]|jgi:hypothetical protein|nr:MAG: Uncharacterised protein [Flavobacteriaceae bacterium]
MKPIYITLFILLLFSCKKNPTRQEVDNPSSVLIYSKLQGTWINTLDPYSTLTFEDKNVINRYDGIAVKKNIGYTIEDSCAGTNLKNTPIEKNKYIQTNSTPRECYYIIKLDTENLIIGLWGTQQPLRFKKKTENNQES